MSYNEKLRCDCLTTNYEGEKAWLLTPEWELYTAVVTTMGTEDKFYERGNDRVRRIAELVRKVDPLFVAQLAIYAREKMYLRSVPLLLLVELACCYHGDSLVSKATARTVQRADEITELLMCYQWRTGRKSLYKVSNQLLKGLAEAFNHFDEYQLAKYDRKDRKVTLRDALVLTHPRPKDEAQADIFRRILDNQLETPYTWETQLSNVGQRKFSTKAEKDEAKRESWRKLIASNRLGYMATLRNLRNLLDLHLDSESMKRVCDYLANPTAVHNSKQMPFRYLSAYLQLFSNSGKCDFTATYLEEILCRASAVKNKLESVVRLMEQGFFKARVRRTSRYYVAGNTIFDNAVIRGKLHFSPKKYHLRKSKLSNRLFVHPNERCLAQLRKHREWLATAVRREEKFRKKFQKRELKKGNSRYLVYRALEEAVRHTADNIPGFASDTRILLASDTSGSMCQSISRNSKVMCYHIGLLLSMLMKHKCKDAVTGMFGDIWKEYEMPSENILHNTKEMIALEGEVGYSTNGYLVIDWLIEQGRVMDKVMLFTDCQLWNSNGWFCSGSLSESWDRYKEIAPDAKLYIFDLAGYGHSPVDMKRDDVFCISGWSDKVFDILAALEQGSNAIDEIRRIVV